uniref:Cyclin-dependent kinase inhibitor domain-containing protein n=1 Tax=Romanomermis culicivorax TaxID=13658 RepID=A0A915KMA4_ROMCU
MTLAFLIRFLDESCIVAFLNDKRENLKNFLAMYMQKLNSIENSGKSNVIIPVPTDIHRRDLFKNGNIKPRDNKKKINMLQFFDILKDKNLEISVSIALFAPKGAAVELTIFLRQFYHQIMPTLSENFSPNFQFRRSLLLAENSPRSARPVRRCLFGDVNDETRRKTDEWLENRLAEIKQENREKSLLYGFDFENERPMSENEVSTATGKCQDYEWIGCSAESMPSFYSRPPAARPEKLQRFPALNEHFSTPVKSSSTKTTTQPMPSVQRKILTPARRGGLTNGAATPLSNHSETTSVFVRPMPAPAFNLLEPVPAGLSETTPHKPPESLMSDDGKISPTFCETYAATSSSTGANKIAGKSSMVIQRRRNIAQDDQSKMTTTYLLTRPCRTRENGVLFCLYSRKMSVQAGTR